jgi:hypothetical protein
MSRVEFESTTPVFERAKNIHASVRGPLLQRLLIVTWLCVFKIKHNLHVSSILILEEM